MKDWYEPLRNVPWPVDERQRAQIPNWIDTDHEHAEKSKLVLADMLRQGLGKSSRIDENFDAILAWSKKHQRPIVINEFGVYTKHADKNDAMAWTAAVREAAEQRGFGWSLWDYLGDFGFGGDVVPGRREWDSERLEALGF